MVKVCDAIMGSGKTSAVISYINAHPEKRFLYITPLLDEASRINTSCPDAHFVEPSSTNPKYSFSKSKHTTALIEVGRNITSTHQAALYYTKETLRLLKKMNYTIIIDEEITVFEQDNSISYGDVMLTVDSGHVVEEKPGYFVRTSKEYGGDKLYKMFRMMESRPLIRIGKKKNDKMWYWVYPKEFLESADEVIVLTYLFHNSEMDLFLQMNNIEYTYIGVHKSDDGKYEFTDHPDYIPDYVSTLKDKIHILEDKKLNAIGDGKHDLSMNWYKTHEDDVGKLRANIWNYFNRKTNSVPERRLCGTYNSYWGKIRGKGFWNSDLAFSIKATNKYRDKNTLVYPVNLFPNGHVVTFYKNSGYDFDKDRYALSIMIQWIWRSAIRDGLDINIYIPSKRMRNLLKNWINDLSNKYEESKQK